MTELEVSFVDGEQLYYVKTCPFCGGDNIEFNDNYTPDELHLKIWVECNHCYAAGPYALDDYEKATDLWNKRQC